MSTFVGLPSVRDDFRCSLCRQKSVFHCEHDTPYRDHILGTYDQEKINIKKTNSRGDTRRTGQHKSNNINNNYSTSNNGMQNVNTGQNMNTTADTRYQQSKRMDNNSVSNTNVNGSRKTNEQKKKTKSCVIL